MTTELKALQAAFERESADCTRFNEEFQKAFELVAKTPRELRDRARGIAAHTARFVEHTQVMCSSARHPDASRHCARVCFFAYFPQVVSQVLVAQKHWPKGQPLWLPPDSAAGGVAGGEKYRLGDVSARRADVVVMWLS